MEIATKENEERTQIAISTIEDIPEKKLLCRKTSRSFDVEIPSFLNDKKKLDEKKAVKESKESKINLPKDSIKSDTVRRPSFSGN